jgi:hypothetical protein
MNEEKSSPRPLRERVTEAAPFDQVAVVRYLTEELPPWPADMSIEGQDPTSSRLATLLSTTSAQPASAKLDPSDAGELATLLLPVAVSDQGLVSVVQDAADRHERDESMNAIEVLSYGAAISFIIFAATTELEWRNGKCVRIVKRSLGDKTLLKVIELLDKIWRTKLP